MHRRVLVLALLSAALLSTTGVLADVVPPDRQVRWHDAGLGGPPPLPSTVVDVRDHSAVGDGVTDDRSAIAAAIAALDGAPGVVWLPPGTWLIRSALSLPSGTVLRGAGAYSTTLRCDRGGVASGCLAVGGRAEGSFRSVLAGFSRGERTLVLADASDLSPGDWAEIRQDNGDWDVSPADWAEHAVGQIVRVTEVEGNDVLLEHPLRVDLNPALDPELRRVVPAADVGIESLRIVRVDEPAEGAGHNIQFSFAVYGWVMGVESDHSVGSHVMIVASSNIEIGGCWFHDAFTYDGAGTRGYGVTLNDRAGECLVENNVFRNLRHAMMTKKGASGNVFAYNYSIEPHRSEPINDATGDISLHGHWSSANLFEGNVVQNVIIDHYWGPSGPFNTFFRNRVEWFGIILTQGSPQTAEQAFVGNEIPKSGYNLLIQIAWGLYYQLRGPGHLAYGNDVDGSIEPSGTGDLTDISYYRAPQDDWCELAPGWPTLGPPNPIGTGSIRARDRYLAGGDVSYRRLQLEMPADAAIESGETAWLEATAVGGVPPLVASWSPEAGLDDPASFAPIAAPDADTTYTLTVTDGAGCRVFGEVGVAVAGGPVDECARGEHDCAPEAECTDTADGYTCTCREGYAGDGRSCDPIVVGPSPDVRAIREDTTAPPPGDAGVSGTGTGSGSCHAGRTAAGDRPSSSPVFLMLALAVGALGRRWGTLRAKTRPPR